MSNISFTCPHCSFSKQLPASAEGQQGNCPSCNAVVTISPNANAPAVTNPAGKKKIMIWVAAGWGAMVVLGLVLCLVLFVVLPDQSADQSDGLDDISTPEQLLAAYFGARSIDERLLYVADRKSNEADMREQFKDKDWNNPTTFTFISMDEVSPNETRVLYSLYLPVIWEVILKKEGGNYAFDYSTEKINSRVKIAGLKVFPGVDVGIFFSNPRAYSDQLVRLDTVKLLGSAQGKSEGDRNNFANILVRAVTDQSGLHKRTVFLSTTRFPKMREGDVASFIATVKIIDDKPFISLIEMIEGS